MTEIISAKDYMQRVKKKTARVDREGPIHLQCLHWLQWQFPDAVIHHSANELNMAGTPTARKIAQGKAKKMGMLPGFPDLIMFWRCHAWAFEIKAPEGRLTKEQKDVGARLVANGFRWDAAYSLADVQALVAVWRKDVVMRAPMRGQVT